MGNNQTEANKRWQAKNKERTKYLHDRSVARAFIRNQATYEDLLELAETIAIRRKEVDKGEA